MAPDLVADRVRRCIAEVLDEPDARITAETPLGEPGGLDSIDDAEVVMAIEEEFNLEISEATADAWVTVGDAIAFVKARVSQ